MENWMTAAETEGANWLAARKYYVEWMLVEMPAGCIDRKLKLM
jgi:hypothetical protein